MSIVTHSFADDLHRSPTIVERQPFRNGALSVKIDPGAGREARQSPPIRIRTSFPFWRFPAWAGIRAFSAVWRCWSRGVVVVSARVNVGPHSFGCRFSCVVNAIGFVLDGCLSLCKFWWVFNFRFYFLAGWLFADA